MQTRSFFFHKFWSGLPHQHHYTVFIHDTYDFRLSSHFLTSISFLFTGGKSATLDEQVEKSRTSEFIGQSLSQPYQPDPEVF